MRTALQKNTAIRLFYDSTESELSHEYTIDGVLGSGANCFVYNAHWSGHDGQVHHVRLKECFPARAAASRLPTQSVHWEDAQEKDSALKRFYHAYEACLKFQSYTETNNATAHIIDGLLWGNSTRYAVIDVDEGTVYSSILKDSINDMFKTILALTQVTKKYHDAGYLLLDIKPDNLLILPETRELIKLFDFDSILSKDDIRKKETPISYSYDFAAPELCAGDRKRICDATDFYSIGTIAFKTIMGRLPTVDDCSRFSNWDFSSSELFNVIGPRAIRLTRNFFHKTLSASTTGRYHNADAMIRAIKTLVAETDTAKVFLAGTRPYSTSYFIGREKELLQIHNSFVSGHRSVFLSGIGGIGKTVLAKQYAEKYRDNYDTICVGLYTDNTPTLLSDQSFIKIVHGDSFDTTEERIRQLRTLVDEHTLLIIDNYEVNDSDDYFDSLLELDCKILITSRSDLSEQFSDALSSKHISVSSLQSEECWQLFCRYYPKAEYLGTRSIIERLFSLVANHTLFITLLAKNFVASGLTPTDMFKHFTDDGMCGISTSIIRHQKDKNVIATIAGHFETLFKISDLADSAKSVVACLSMLGNIHINKRGLALMCGCPLDTINQDLVERGWLQYDSVLEEVNMHPVVSVTVMNVLKPSDDIRKTLKEYIDRIVFDYRYMDLESCGDYRGITNTLDQANLDNRVMFLIEFFKHLSLDDPDNLEYIVETLFDLCVILGIAPDEININFLYDRMLAEKITPFLSNGSVPELTLFKGYGFIAFSWTKSLRTIYAQDNEERHAVAYSKAFECYQKSITALKQATLSIDDREQYAMKLLWPVILFFSGFSYLFNDEYYELPEYVRDEFESFSLKKILDDEQSDTYDDFLYYATSMFIEEKKAREAERQSNISNSSEEQEITDPGPDGDPSNYYCHLLFESPERFNAIQPIVEMVLADSRLDKKGKFKILEGNPLYIAFVPRLYWPLHDMKYRNEEFLEGVVWIHNIKLNLFPNESDPGYTDGSVWEGYTIGDELAQVEAYMQLAAAHILLGNQDQVVEKMEDVQFEVNYALEHRLNADLSLDYQAEEVERQYIGFLFTMFALGCAKQIIVYLEDYISQQESYGITPYSLYDLALHCAQELHNNQMEYKYRIKIGNIAGTFFRYNE
jgi:serine/threonine protein kinase